jgi:chromosome segregation ATPase
MSELGTTVEMLVRDNMQDEIDTLNKKINSYEMLVRSIKGQNSELRKEVENLKATLYLCDKEEISSLRSTNEQLTDTIEELEHDRNGLDLYIEELETIAEEFRDRTLNMALEIASLNKQLSECRYALLEYT